jgi:protease I
VVDEAVAVDENIITSRKPDDVEPFTNAVIDLVENAPEVSEIHNPREVPA